VLTGLNTLDTQDVLSDVLVFEAHILGHTVRTVLEISNIWIAGLNPASYVDVGPRLCVFSYVFFL
jgi:hypothetical protein